MAVKATGRKLREDLEFSPYAVALGYAIMHGHWVEGHTLDLTRFVDGVDPSTHQFRLGDVYVWETARGWRVSSLIDGTFTKPESSEFFTRLRPALEHGAKLHLAALAAKQAEGERTAAERIETAIAIVKDAGADWSGLADDQPNRVTNHYRHCGQEWSDDSPSTNNDACPVCGAEIEPYESVDIEDDEEED